MKHLSIITLLLSISCSEQNMMIPEQGNDVTNAADSMFPSIRVDVYPVSDNENLLPQSFSVDPDSEDRNALRFDLADTVELSGHVHGTTIYPHSDGVSVPSSRAAIEAQIQLSIPNALNGSIVNTDEEGWFTLMVPANDQYHFSILMNFYQKQHYKSLTEKLKLEVPKTKYQTMPPSFFALQLIAQTLYLG